MNSKSSPTLATNRSPALAFGGGGNSGAPVPIQLACRAAVAQLFVGLRKLFAFAGILALVFSCVLAQTKTSSVPKKPSEPVVPGYPQVGLNWDGFEKALVEIKPFLADEPGLIILEIKIYNPTFISIKSGEGFIRSPDTFYVFEKKQGKWMQTRKTKVYH